MFAQIDTPSVVIDLDVAEANIAKYQAYCDQHGFALRPHIKTHKLPRLAKAQLAAGAQGITCQKISEAEAMLSEGGIDDILLTYNVLGDAKLARLRALADRVRLTVVADSQTVVDGLARAFADAPNRLRVLVECDTGAGRCGVMTPEAALDLARYIAAQTGLEFVGLMTYPGIGQEAQIEAWLTTAKGLIEAAQMKVGVVSTGGSPGMWRAHEMPVTTEYRIGTYIYNDRSLQVRGVCDWADCALTVLATVVSVPTSGRAIIDAGSKVLTSDLFGLQGHGHVLGRPDISIDSLSEEHGRLVAADINLQVGDRIRIVPNHACVVSNMLDHVIMVRGDSVIGPEPVIARGQVW